MPDLQPVGECAVRVALGERIDPQVNAQVQRLARWLRAQTVAGLGECVPGYATLLVYYDPLKLGYAQVANLCLLGLDESARLPLPEPRLVTIPVRYGGEDGPDLAEVAAQHGLTIAEAIQLHCQPTYRVYLMGFTPGFAYLGELHPRLVTPRLQTPRAHVPAGSVGIAGAQTGVYPIASPGGWRIIGRTDLRLFDPQQEPPTVLQPGDAVRFIDLDG